MCRTHMISSVWLCPGFGVVFEAAFYLTWVLNVSALCFACWFSLFGSVWPSWVELDISHVMRRVGVSVLSIKACRLGR